jgi:hypothetical protein
MTVTSGSGNSVPLSFLCGAISRFLFLFLTLSFLQRFFSLAPLFSPCLPLSSGLFLFLLTRSQSLRAPEPNHQLNFIAAAGCKTVLEQDRPLLWPARSPDSAASDRRSGHAAQLGPVDPVEAQGRELRHVRVGGDQPHREAAPRAGGAA